MFKEKVIYDQEYIDGLRERNAKRLEDAKKKLGNKWLVHPENKLTKLKEQKK